MTNLVLITVDGVQVNKVNHTKWISVGDARVKIKPYGHESQYYEIPKENNTLLDFFLSDTVTEQEKKDFLNGSFEHRPKTKLPEFSFKPLDEK